MVKSLLYLLAITVLTLQTNAQAVNCTFKDPVVTINFGTGSIGDRSAAELSNYRFVTYSCPTDGHYTYTSSTSDCFSGDWVTISEDHTPGDVDGNMMLVNASPRSGTFLTTNINRLKPGTIYEFSVWMMNVCKPSDKCPFPLLPEISIMLVSVEGKTVAQFGTGELTRRNMPQWTRYEAIFTTPASESPLTLVMVDNAPGGCGNDFALDDISFRECVPIKPIVNTPPKTPVPGTKKKIDTLAKKKPEPAKTVVKKPEPVPVTKTLPPPEKKPPVAVVQKPKPKTTPIDTSRAAKPRVPIGSTLPGKRQPEDIPTSKPQTDRAIDSMPVMKRAVPVLAPPPPVIVTRANPLIKLIEAEAGEIKVDLYDNGEIDGDTISVYHNNSLIVSHARLALKPISFRITVDAAHPHHELVLVAHNLGSIPPNTSLMVVTAGAKRYEVFISSTEQKNAKLIIDLKE